MPSGVCCSLGRVDVALGSLRCCLNKQEQICKAAAAVGSPRCPWEGARFTPLPACPGSGMGVAAKQALLRAALVLDSAVGGEGRQKQRPCRSDLRVGGSLGAELRISGLGNFYLIRLMGFGCVDVTEYG